MSYSKPLPPFTFDLLCFLNKYQLERFSIVCRPLKNFIERYFNSKPYRIFHHLYIRGGSYALVHNLVQWHLNRDDYSVQQFLTGQECSLDESKISCLPKSNTYYSFAEMRPYLRPTVRIKSIVLRITAIPTFNSEHINEMESVAYLWHDVFIRIAIPPGHEGILSRDFQLILNSPTILQCQTLCMGNAHFSFKNYKVLYTVNVIEMNYEYQDIDSTYWPQFLEQPGVKPLVVMREVCREIMNNMLDCISKAFSSAVSPNTFKVIIINDIAKNGEPLTEFRETNKTLGEILQFKKGLPVDYQDQIFEQYYNYYTLERSSI